jgi:chloride channel protein, CIC family
MLENIRSLKNSLFQVNSRSIYVYSLLTGLITGMVAILFNSIIHFLSSWLFVDVAGYHIGVPGAGLISRVPVSHPYSYVIVFFIPIIGGLLCGLITRFWAPEAKGAGIDLYLDTFHNKEGHLRKRTTSAKFLASMMTLASGGSAGKEGPMALIGAGVGSLLSKLVKMGARARRTLLLAGAAGGLGAIFRAPLGGAITAVEVLYKEDFESDSLVPCIISSVTAYTLFSSFVGFSHNLHYETTIFHSPIELIFYIGLGIFCSGAAFFFVHFFVWIEEKVFLRLPVPSFLLPAIGGAVIGIFAIIFPQVIGEGLQSIQQAIDGHYQGSWIIVSMSFLLLAVFKMFATGVTIQSGGSGGALIPSLFIGAMLGGFFGSLCHHFAPTYVPEVTPFVIVGMAAFFAGVTNASLGALVMVTELTGGYEMLPPLMIVCVISLLTTNRWALYKNQVRNKFQTKAHAWDMKNGD